MINLFLNFTYQKKGGYSKKNKQIKNKEYCFNYYKEKRESEWKLSFITCSIKNVTKFEKANLKGERCQCRPVRVIESVLWHVLI